MALFSLPKTARVTLAVIGLLIGALAVSTIIIWRRLPVEGVKLHGNIDVGIDLLGTRNDALWVFMSAVVIVVANLGLAVWLQTRETLAAVFLLGTTIPLLVGLTGALWFIFLLNQPL